MISFNGKLLFLDRSDINTDEIIPAKYLTESTKLALKPYCLEDLKLEGFDPKTDVPGKAAIVTRSNFGCGSSREHAPWSLEVNGIRMVIAESYARIFRQNMFNCGLLAIELSPEQIDALFAKFANTEAGVKLDLAKKTLEVFNNTDSAEYAFEISPFDLELVKAGGWVAYADANY